MFSHEETLSVEYTTCELWRENMAWLLLRLNEELFPNEGESIQQKPHSVDCGTPMKDACAS